MGGLYNIIHGYNQACLWIMPMLNKHEDEWPRFRDCYVEKSKEHKYLICVFTRVGGGNRNCGYGEDKLYEDPLYVSTEDWEEDTTYAVYRFKVPPKWKHDFYAILNGNLWQVSKAYRDHLKKFWPLLSEKGFFKDEIFKKPTKEDK